MLAALDSDSAAYPACTRCRSCWLSVDCCWLSWVLLHDLLISEMQTLPDALQVRLWQFGKLLPPKLADHLEQHGALPVLYVSAWLLTSFSADFPLYFASRVMDVVLSDSVFEGGMKVRCLAAEEVVGILWCTVHHADCCWLSARVQLGRLLEGATKETHTKQPNTDADWVVPVPRCRPPYACLTASTEVDAVGTQLCSRSVSAASQLLPDPWRPSCHMQVALGIVLHCEKSLLMMEDMEEMVDFLKSEVGPACAWPAAPAGVPLIWPPSVAPEIKGCAPSRAVQQACRHCLNACSCRSPAGAVRCCRTSW